ncbi:MAG: PspA-associated protein PspAB [Carbonactinosporaceae bacterium]
MGFLDVLLGRRQPRRPDLDQLFGLPSAALTLEAAAGFQATGVGSVCFKPAEGGAFARTQADIQALLDADGGPKVEESTDEYGFTWLVARHDPAELSALVADLHAVNVSLQDAGFGPMLLCSLVAFRDGEDRRIGLVYLYKRGTFYPFAPQGGEVRDTGLELQVRAHIENDLRVESDLSRWFPVWRAPGL